VRITARGMGTDQPGQRTCCKKRGRAIDLGDLMAQAMMPP